LVVLRPVGRLDSAASAEFQARLVAAVSTPANVVIDFSGVEYISSIGLRALMTAAKLKSPDCHIAVAALSDFVREIFTIARFMHIVTIIARVEDAADAWRGAAQAAMTRPAERPKRSGAVNSVRFWGSRGSLPAPLGADSVRAKISDALLAARGRIFETREALSTASCRSRYAVRLAATPVASRLPVAATEMNTCCAISAPAFESLATES
jgi:anti-sigma B factor antagonist